MTSSVSTWTPPASKPVMMVLFNVVSPIYLDTHKKERRVLQHRDAHQFFCLQHTLICQQSSHQHHIRRTWCRSSVGASCKNANISWNCRHTSNFTSRFTSMDRAKEAAASASSTKWRYFSAPSRVTRPACMAAFSRNFCCFLLQRLGCERTISA